jgi:hypothetical protein
MDLTFAIASRQLWGGQGGRDGEVGGAKDGRGGGEGREEGQY